MGILNKIIGRRSEDSENFGAWTRKADMPTPREHLGVGIINGKLYAVGGLGRIARKWAPLSTLEVFTPPNQK